MDEMKTIYVVEDQEGNITQIFDSMEDAEIAGVEAIPREMSADEIEKIKEQLVAGGGDETAREDWEDELDIDWEDEDDE